MSKQDVDSLLAKKTTVSLRQIFELCAEDSAAADEGADSLPDLPTDAHIAAYLAARNIPEHEPLEAYGLGSLGIAERPDLNEPPPARHSTEVITQNETRQCTQPDSPSPWASISRCLEQVRLCLREGGTLPKVWRLAIGVPVLLTCAVTVFLAPSIFPNRVGTVSISPASPSEGQTRTYPCAPRGAHKPAPLADGSTVDLNSGTCVNVMLSTHERSLTLESGEAVFQVTPERNRPFIVAIGHIQVRVLGTRFDVYAGKVNPYTGERSTRIAVFDGAIQITLDSRSPPIRLIAGELIEIPNDATKVAYLRHMLDGDFERMTAWRHGVLEFKEQPLREVLAEYGRYQAIAFESEDPEMLNLPISGVFQTTDVAHLLSLLKHLCIQSAYEDGGQKIVLSRSAGKRDDRVCQ